MVPVSKTFVCPQYAWVIEFGNTILEIVISTISGQVVFITIETESRKEQNVSVSHQQQ